MRSPSGTAVGEHPRRAAGGEQHDVGLDGVGDRAGRVEDLDPVRARRLLGGEPARAGERP